MSSMEDGKNGFKKGKSFQQTTLTGDKIVADAVIKEEEEREVTVSAENFKKLLYVYGQFHGISGGKLEDIIEGEKSGNNGDVYLAQLKHAYVRMCSERGGGYFPRGYRG